MRKNSSTRILHLFLGMALATFAAAASSGDGTGGGGSGGGFSETAACQAIRDRLLSAAQKGTRI